MEESTIRSIIEKVNTTLSYFDAGYISARRTEDIKERCFTFDTFVECRFNYELGKLDEFKDLFLDLDGKVFSCSLDEPNLVKRNFKLATLTIQIPKTLLETHDALNDEVNRFISWFGGNRIRFTHKKKKFNYIIDIYDSEFSE
jgi:hypothetical protein